MKRRNISGITLVSLVVTIIVLLILAGISLNLMIGQDGIITKAVESGKVQKIAEIKEKIGLDLLDADTQARLRGEKLEQVQKEDIASKYGELQEDGDTLNLKDVDATVSLKEIWNGETATTGSYTENKEKIEELQKRIEELEKALEAPSILFFNNGMSYTATGVEKRTVSLSSYSNFKNLKLNENLFIVPEGSLSMHCAYDRTGLAGKIYTTYDANTGNLTYYTSIQGVDIINKNYYVNMSFKILIVD